MPTGRRRLASSLRAAEPSSPNEAKALSNNPADNTRTADRIGGGYPSQHCPSGRHIRELLCTRFFEDEFGSVEVRLGRAQAGSRPFRTAGNSSIAGRRHHLSLSNRK